MSIFRIFRNKEFDNWQTCKSCGGSVEYHPAVWWRWLVLNDGGFTECNNCGKKVIVP